MKDLRTLLCIIAILVCPTAAYAQTGNEEAICTTPAVFYCENFEDRTVGTGSAATQMNQARYKNPAWGFSGGGEVNFSVTTAQHKDGTKSLRNFFGAGYNGTGIGFIDTTPPSAPQDFYIRFYAFLPTGFPLGCQNGVTPEGVCRNKWIELLGGGGTPFDVFLWHFDTNVYGLGVPNGIPADLPVSSAGSGQDGSFRAMNENGSVLAVRDTWQCIEAHVKVNSSGGASDGVIEGWIDGVRHWNHSNYQLQQGTPAGLGLFRITGSGSTNIYPNIGGSGGVSRYIDNIVMSTQRIGCIGGAPAGLNAPANLLLCTGAGCVPAMVVPLGALAGLLVWARRRLTRSA